MTSATFSTSVEAQQAAVLLEGYHFEVGHHDARQWVSLWLEFYPPSWIREAVIEALYQGRYKSVSVRQILELWHRRGQPIRHASHEFEAAVCRDFESDPQKNAELKRSSISAAALPHVQKRSRTVASRSIKKLKHPPMAAVSFDLAALPTISALTPSSTAPQEPLPSSGDSASALALDSAPAVDKASANGNPIRSAVTDDGAATDTPDNRSWRDFPTYAMPNADEILATQRQFNGVLQVSARAIQPFKPALPFSAQTLRLAKQKALTSSP